MKGILSFIDGPLDGDSWERLCNACYRDRYKEFHYTEIPAAYQGDAGIEGFTTNGIVTQCYAPEKEFTDNELYNHLRDKMTADINKLKKLSIAIALLSWGFLQLRSGILLFRSIRMLELLSMQKQSEKRLLVQRKPIRMPTHILMMDFVFLSRALKISEWKLHD